MSNLNSEQRLIVSAPPDQDMLVLSPPGSGKTRVLIERIRYLLESGVVPSDILAITFTRKAAGELRERLGRTDITACTFHALAFHNLPFRTVYSQREQKIAWANATGGQSEEILKAITLRRLKLEPLNTEESYLHGLYTSLLISNNATDYTGLLEDYLAQGVDGCYPFVLVDEINDVNKLQLSIADKIAGKLFCVGDIFQQIYLFQAAHRETLNYLRERRSPREYRLTTNYRSTTNIVNFCKDIIRGRESEPIIEYHPATPRSGPPVRSIHTSKIDHDHDLVHLVRTIATVSSPASISILCRSNAQVLRACSALESSGIFTHSPSSISILDREVVRPLISYLKFLNNRSDILSLREFIVFGRNGIGPRRFTAEKAIAMLGVNPEDIEAAMTNTGFYAKIDSDTTRSVASRALVSTFLTIYDQAEDKVEFISSISVDRDLEDDPAPNQVRVMTIHKAKGLEFDNVIVAHVGGNSFPIPTADLREERRVFFVASSRAKERLYILCKGPQTLIPESSNMMRIPNLELPWRNTRRSQSLN